MAGRRQLWSRWWMVVAYAVVVLAGAGLCVAQARWDHRTEAALDAGRLCAGSSHDDCLVEVGGRLQGPYAEGKNGPRTSWTLGQRDVQLSQDDTDRLTGGGAAVTGLLYDDELVALRTSDGRVLRSDELGSSAPYLWWVGSGALVVVALFLLWLAAVVRRKQARPQAEAPAR